VVALPLVVRFVLALQRPAFLLVLLVVVLVVIRHFLFGLVVVRCLFLLVVFLRFGVAS